MKEPQNFSLPAVTGNADTLTRHFLTQFLYEFRSQRGRDSYYRIYTAIENTAKKTGNAPEVVARALVESGLRAARESFPGSFVETVEKKSAEPQWNIGALTPQQRELMSFWNTPATDYKPVRRYH
jgi:hypothetical protein